MKKYEPPKTLREICGNCGKTRGSHKAGGSFSEHYKKYFPADYCPGNEGRMDWDAGPGTTFKPSGEFPPNPEEE